MKMIEEWLMMLISVDDLNNAQRIMMYYARQVVSCIVMLMLKVENMGGNEYSIVWPNIRMLYKDSNIRGKSGVSYK